MASEHSSWSDVMAWQNGVCWGPGPISRGTVGDTASLHSLSEMVHRVMQVCPGMAARLAHACI